jgi:hypothetical protein
MKSLGTFIPAFAPVTASLPLTQHHSLTDHDLRAIYEYLRVFPPATPGPLAPPTSGGVDLRLQRCPYEAQLIAQP